MKKRLQNFFKFFICFSLIFSIILCVCAYAFDPQNIYRWNDGGMRFYNSRFSAAGSIKNYDYDFIVIGSSMVQNFDAESISKTFDCRPLKVTLGGMTAGETVFAYNQAQKTGKAKRYLVSLDLHRIAAAESVCEDAGRFPDYMFGGGISQFKYLLGFETWFKFIPTDLFLIAASLMPNVIPSSYTDKIKESTDINSMCQWDNTKLPGKEKLIENFRNNVKTFDEGDNSVFSANAVKNAENIMTELLKNLDEDEELYIYLPAYSVLYWAGKTDEQTETLLKMREAVYGASEGHGNVKILDFQGLQEINDLDSYFDESHYGKELCDFIEKNLNSEEYFATEKSIADASRFIKESRKKYI